jgi:hypothetical protein
MTTVQVERPENTKLADWFAELRLWFDNNDCSPMLFTVAGRVMNRERFNIKFADDAQARLFASTFAHYGPSIVSPIGGEPSGLHDGLDLAGARVDDRIIENGLK